MPKPKKPIERRKLHIRTGDEVLVLSGSGSKEKTPHKVIAVDSRLGKVTVEGVNVRKDRPKKQSSAVRQSGINQQEEVDKAFPIDISNVALVDPKSKKATRVKVVTGQDGKRTRTAAKSGETI